jgi:hypothetical protein
VRGDHHAAVDDLHQGAAATGPVGVAGELSCPQVGVGPLSGPPTRKLVDGSGVMRLIERHRTRGYSDHGVPGSLVGAGVVEPRGFLPMDWSQCAS